MVKIDYFCQMYTFFETITVVNHLYCYNENSLKTQTRHFVSFGYPHESIIKYSFKTLILNNKNLKIKITCSVLITQ